MFIFLNFLEKNENFWQFFWKKCQVFDNFLTVKWQFSGGSGLYTPRRSTETGRNSQTPDISIQCCDWTIWQHLAALLNHSTGSRGMTFGVFCRSLLNGLMYWKPHVTVIWQTKDCYLFFHQFNYQRTEILVIFKPEIFSLNFGQDFFASSWLQSIGQTRRSLNLYWYLFHLK